MFVLSADTFGRENDEPWAQPPDTNDLEMCMEFMARHTGPADVLLTFDGRNVAARKYLQQEMEAVAVKERGAGPSAWGETTHDTVYSGVLPVPWDGLPMISRTDKARVMNKRSVDPSTLDTDVPIPARKVFDTDRGLPLYCCRGPSVPPGRVPICGALPE